MIDRAKQVARKYLRPKWTPPSILEEVGDWERGVIAEVDVFTMTPPERIYALTEAVRYVVERDVPGAFAECGVWRGGSVLAMIRALQREGVNDRDIFLYDTFEGMTKPSDIDTSRYQASAITQWNKAERKGVTAWPYWFNEELFNLDLVKRVLQETGYPSERLHFVQGRVEDTIPANVPEQIALLRLDTDWYESTRHEMVHLYPLISTSGVLLIDDYGYWDGCRKAVDEYFGEPGHDLPLLNRVDHSCRIAVKS